MIGVILALGLLLASCAMPPRWHHIQSGMPKDEVVRQVGEPSRRTYEGHFSNGAGETWYYDYANPNTRAFEPHWVRFHDGHVTATDIDPERIRQVERNTLEEARRKQLLEVAPPDVGFKCDDGSECRSGKCLRHQCVGARDCTRGPGADCRSNLDCCSNRCNFGSLRCY